VPALCRVASRRVVQEVVKELLAYLVTAEFAIKVGSLSQRVTVSVVCALVRLLRRGRCFVQDEMVLKTAILAERFAPNMKWYVDTALQLISVAGDHVSDDIWHRVVRIVTNNEDLQAYAARKMYRCVGRACCTAVDSCARLCRLAACAVCAAFVVFCVNVYGSFLCDRAQRGVAVERPRNRGEGWRLRAGRVRLPVGPGLRCVSCCLLRRSVCMLACFFCKRVSVRFQPMATSSAASSSSARWSSTSSGCRRRRR
jgi:hypothetical protein